MTLFQLPRMIRRGRYQGACIPQCQPLNDAVDRFCGSFKLYLPDGTAISHEQCWMGRALEMGTAFNGEEIIVERPDGTRLTALAHANPIRDQSGKLVGAVNVLIDISDRVQSYSPSRSPTPRAFSAPSDNSEAFSNAGEQGRTPRVRRRPRSAIFVLNL